MTLDGLDAPRPSPPAPNNAAAAAGGADGPAGAGRAAAAAMAAAGGTVGSAGAPADSPAGPGHSEAGRAAAAGGEQPPAAASGAPADGPAGPGQGTRVVPRGKAQEIAGHTFVGYGSHTDAYPHVYLTAAAAIGTTKGEVDEFVARLTKAYREFQAKQRAALAR
ncbi:hypothetical protein FOA52_007249 [Chlamydomonas sp. UWO 241]|nr:hypothetical protein FOA52_007249 [Chlamydomonas sp. UWO 241]